jgi:hypothetical protein
MEFMALIEILPSSVDPRTWTKKHFFISWPTSRGHPLARNLHFQRNWMDQQLSPSPYPYPVKYLVSPWIYRWVFRGLKTYIELRTQFLRWERRHALIGRSRGQMRLWLLLHRHERSCSLGGLWVFVSDIITDADEQVWLKVSLTLFASVELDCLTPPVLVEKNGSRTPSSSNSRQRFEARGQAISSV